MQSRWPPPLPSRCVFPSTCRDRASAQRQGGATTGVERVSVNKQPGDRVSARHGAFTDRVVRAEVLVTSYEELLDVTNRIDSTYSLSVCAHRSHQRR